MAEAAKELIENTPQNLQDDADRDLSVFDFYGDESHKEFYERRNALLSDIPHEIVQKAWFTASHLMVPENAKIIDMGCGDGKLTYIMAVLNPNLYFTGIDKDKRRINKAKQLSGELHNLEFQHGTYNGGSIAPSSVDAIINSDILHHVFSSGRYNDESVSETLETQFKALRSGGVMFIRDFARPPPEQYVLMEMADKPSHSDEIKDLSEADLLVWYSENARPKQDPGCGGFFLEELPARLPNTRLFRLPYKWAYEFIMRKDDRDQWTRALPLEYTFFTEIEFRRELRNLGARVEYSGPLYEEDVIEKRFDNSFTLYNDEGKKLGYPPTGFVAVARKMTERKSLNIFERRPSADEKHKTSLHISAMRNEKNGQIVDVVTPEDPINEVIPYRIGDDGRLKVFLHEGVARALSNTVARNGKNIDGKRWSGHMLEPISVFARIFDELDEITVKDTVLFSRDHLGFKPQSEALLIEGPDFYPSPDFIDERIFTYFLHVQKPRGAVSPKSFTGHSGDFLAKGQIREFDAQKIMDAITVGMISNSRLELQLLNLFEHLKIPAETWTDKAMKIAGGKITGKLNMITFLKQLSNSDKRFTDIRGSTGDLRNMHSIFVEEGQTQGATTGLTARDLDFVISEDKTINTAVIVPLCKDMKGDIHAGFAVDHLPVPQRHEGNGMTLKSPSFNIPDNITNLADMKAFIAEKFSVTPDMVVKMGESYFTHIGVTPHRIYPFGVGRPPQSWMDESELFFIPLNQMRLVWKAIKADTHMMTVVARSYKMFNDDMFFGMKGEVKNILTNRFENQGMSAPDWSIPATYVASPGLKSEEPAPALDLDVSVKTTPPTFTPESSAPAASEQAIQTEAPANEKAVIQPPAPAPEQNREEQSQPATEAQKDVAPNPFRDESLSQKSDTAEPSLEDIAAAADKVNDPKPKEL